MKIRLTSIQIALLISSLYFFLGNIVGYFMSVSILNVENILVYIFYPYTVIWGACSMVGWDALAFIFEIILFGIMTLVCYPIGLRLSKIRRLDKSDL